jgi:hypothetical protein
MVGRAHNGDHAAAVLLCVLLCIGACSYDWTLGKGAGGSAGSSAGGSSSSQCAALKASLTNARKDAKACDGALADCSQVIADECGCSVHVSDDTFLVGKYQELVNQFNSAGCVADCQPPCDNASSMCTITGTSGTEWVCSP